MTDGRECDGPDCNEALQKLYLFIDHELEDASCEQIQAHIDNCRACLTEYELDILVKALLSRSCSETAPPPLRERVLLSIRTVQVEVREQRD
ncbi:mycothiol system anti-sigma-R factor [Aeromicrobium sp. PE09-221]|nr:mycothiol system anti-sigma-R factor [Aeromicrobium sp. PE09-221]